MNQFTLPINPLMFLGKCDRLREPVRGTDLWDDPGFSSLGLRAAPASGIPVARSIVGQSIVDVQLLSSKDIPLESKGDRPRLEVFFRHDIDVPSLGRFVDPAEGGRNPPPQPEQRQDIEKGDAQRLARVPPRQTAPRLPSPWSVGSMMYRLSVNRQM